MSRRTIVAAVCDRVGAVPVVRELTIDAPRADEVLVRIHACGVCHTDMVLRDGVLPLTFPAVLGHEGAGVVEAVGADIADLAPGDRVVLSFHSCRACRNCDDGAPAYCEHIVPLNFDGRRGDGTAKLADALGGAVSGNVFGQSAFATHALAYRDNVVRVDGDVPFDLLAPLGCGIQTGAGTVLETLRVPSGARLAVLGAGAVGCAAIMAARVAGAAVVAVLDRHSPRLEVASKIGATDVTDCVEALPGDLDYIIDTTGVPSVAAAAAVKLGIRGTLALVGAYPPSGGLAIEPSFLMSAGRRVIGVVEGGVDPQLFVPKLVALLTAGFLPIGQIIKRYSLNDVAQAIADSESGEVIKPVLIMTPK